MYNYVNFEKLFYFRTVLNYSGSERKLGQRIFLFLGFIFSCRIERINIPILPPKYVQ